MMTSMMAGYCLPPILKVTGRNGGIPTAHFIIGKYGIEILKREQMAGGIKITLFCLMKGNGLRA